MRTRETGLAPAVRRRGGVRVRRRFDASAQRVFAAWLEPGMARRWLFATAAAPLAEMEIEARVNGGFRLIDRHQGIAEYRGRYTCIDASRRLAFVLAHERYGPSRVCVDIVERARGCELWLTHDDVPEPRVGAVRDRWTGIMYGLALALDADDSINQE